MLRNLARIYPKITEISSAAGGRLLLPPVVIRKGFAEYYSIGNNLKRFTNTTNTLKIMSVKAECKRSYAVGDVKVSHDKASTLFYIDVPGEGRAFLEYERHGNLIRILHTEVPKKLEGRGLGKLLAKEALDYVVKNDYKAEIECQFVKSYVKKYDPSFIKYLKS